MSRLLFLIVAWFFFSISCLAGEREQNVIAKTFPQASIVDLSVNPIDGKTYLAALVFDERQSAISLAIFAADEGGFYKLHTKSKWQDRHSRWYDTSVKIKNGSVYFSLSGNGGCCSDYSSDYQFKLYDGQFLLVGTESTSTGIESKKDNAGRVVDSQSISYKYGTSINYLTGEILHWRLQAPSSTDKSDELFKDDILRIKAGKKRAEQRFRFTPTKRTKLEDFDIWAESDISEHIGGYFDQDFKYHE